MGVSGAIIAGTTGIREAEDSMQAMRRLGEPFVTGFSDIGPLASRYHIKITEDVAAGPVLGPDPSWVSGRQSTITIAFVSW